jgi:hypothetical protein
MDWELVIFGLVFVVFISAIINVAVEMQNLNQTILEVIRK